MPRSRLLTEQTVTCTDPPVIVGDRYEAFANQAITAVVWGTGDVSAEVQPMVSNDGASWSAFGPSISLSGTGVATGNVTASAPFAYWGAIVTAISGTGAAVNCDLSQV